MKTVLENPKKCTGCHACYNICSVQAIQMVSDPEGFLYPRIDAEACVDCGRCRKVCPAQEQGTLKTAYRATYGCYAKDRDEQMQSSSGGIFALLAKDVLDNNGVVYGAAWDQEAKVYHRSVRVPEDLASVRGSKYVQSSIGRTYREAQQDLKEGKSVLFCGTPCQIAGLKTFLGREYPSLLCVDLICHGVPSPAVWQAYIEEKIGEKTIAAVSFRDKSEGIQDTYLTYTTTDTSVIKEAYADSRYILGFINGFYLRESCYTCGYGGVKRCSDITLGDFWGAKQAHRELSDPYGISLAMIHTAKGEQAFRRLSDRIYQVKTSWYTASLQNENMLHPVPRTNGKDIFWECWNKEAVSPAVEETIRRYQKAPPPAMTFFQKIEWRVHKWLAR